ncbi:MAG: hypothetical protein DSY34_02945 [Desulfurobacterium sp.]|nr:MAG: hypothetical protein DSY34_02945 [Desulfurobacterium sp.]
MNIINYNFLRLRTDVFSNCQEEPLYHLQNSQNRKLLSIVYKLYVTSLLPYKALSKIQNVDIFPLFFLPQYNTLSDLKKRKYINVTKINHKILRETEWN